MASGTRMKLRALLVFGGLSLALGLGASSGSEELGWVLDSRNWQKAEGLLPQPVMRRLTSGDYSYRVVDVPDAAFRENYPESFWQKSRANEGRYSVNPETCALLESATGERAERLDGFPFVSVTPADPGAACRIVWNMEAANAYGVGQGSDFVLNGIDATGEYKRVKLHRDDEHYLSQPTGAANQERLRHASLTKPLEPLDMQGVVGLTKRTNDDDWDKLWMVVPATGRLRRSHPASRSEPIPGLAIHGEDIGGFDGKIEYFRWNVIGQAEVLGSVVSTRPLEMTRVSDTRFEIVVPYARAAYESQGSSGVPWSITDGAVMVRRPVWVVEGKSLDEHYKFGRIVLYIDRDMYRIYWKLTYDRAGEYFYNAMVSHYWSRHDETQIGAVTTAFVLGVDDKMNRAALAGRQVKSYVERGFPRDYFTNRPWHVSD